MKYVRKVHLYLGCALSPLLIYFALSGAWQLFGLNDVPKKEDVDTNANVPLRRILHALSNPHTHSAFPGKNPETTHSVIFSYLGLMAAVGIIISSILGIILAFKYSKNKTAVIVCLVLGIFLPLVVLFKFID